MRGILVLVVLVVLVAGCKPKEPDSPQSADPPRAGVKDEPKVQPKDKAPKGKEKVTLAKYREMLLGKTKDQIKDRLGKPDTTYFYDTGNGYWTYKDAVWNEDTEKYVRLSIDFDASGVAVAVK